MKVKGLSFGHLIHVR